MCLIAWSWQPHSSTPLVLLSNRDEFYARPAMSLHRWPATDDGAVVWAGKDLQAGGTWLGVTKTGRLAAVTNHRSVQEPHTNPRSRGKLVAGFLQSDLSASDYLHMLSQHTGDYNPFNLLVFDGNFLMGLESRNTRIVTMEPGIGAVSNADFQSPWPKLTRLKSALHATLAADTHAHLPLLELLHDTTLAQDNALPQTGMPLKLERALSSTFITTPGYGTRACSVITLGGSHIEFTEESFDASGLIGTSSHHAMR